MRIPAVLIDASNSGVSGNMLLGALIDLGAGKAVLEGLAEEVPRVLQGCSSVEVTVEEVMRGGFRATYVEVAGEKEGVERSGAEVLRAVEELAGRRLRSERGIRIALNAVGLVVEAEARLHGGDARDLHFHELAAADTLIDIVGFAALLEDLGLTESAFYITPISVGGGRTRFSHGSVSVPPPAVLEILSRARLPFAMGPEEMELATPTGVALLAALNPAVIEKEVFYPERTGYGAGKAKLREVPNMLRITLGRVEAPSSGREKVAVIETNIDDATGETLGYLSEKLLRSGAKDVSLLSAVGKKGRPSTIVRVIAGLEDAERIALELMKETGSLGVRIQETWRMVAERREESVEMELYGRRFVIRIKRSYTPDGVLLNVKPEYEDVRAVAEATGIPLRVVQSEIERRLMEA